MARRSSIMPRMVAVCILLIFCVTGSKVVAGHASTGTYSANFLKMDVGARASALSGAFVAIADDATAGYWNPAGLCHVGAPELVIMHNNWYQDISSNFLGAVFPVSRSVAVGLDISQIDYGSFEGYDQDNQPTGEYSADAIVISTSSAVQLSTRLSMGITGRLISERLERSSAEGYALNFGALYRSSLISVGMNLKNIGKGLKYETDRSPLPRELVLGVAINAYGGRFRLASDVGISDGGGAVLHQGVEYCYLGTVFLRTGYSHNFEGTSERGPTALSMGFGVRHSIGAIDYSYWPGNQLGDTHRISFRLHFGRSD